MSGHFPTHVQFGNDPVGVKDRPRYVPRKINGRWYAWDRFYRETISTGWTNRGSAQSICNSENALRNLS